jgi:hypothetical protein
VVVRVRLALFPFGAVTVAEALPAVRETLRVADCPFGPVTVESTLPPPRVVLRVALCPFGPATVASVDPPDRATLRLALCPFGPVTVEFTLPRWRTAVRVALRPFGPVTVPVEVVCACAIPIVRASAKPATASTDPWVIFVEIVIVLLRLNLISRARPNDCSGPLRQR